MCKRNWEKEDIIGGDGGQGGSGSMVFQCLQLPNFSTQ